MVSFLHLTLVSFFFFSSVCDVVPVVLYNAEKVSNLDVHIKGKNQNTKRRMETRISFCFVFE